MQATLRRDAESPKTIAATKPRLTFWQVWNMSFGFLGIQIGFMLAQSNMPRIFQTLGSDIDKVGYLMIAGPVTGLLVQPIVGYLSDRTWGRFGRRRPYFLVGAILASLALLAAPHSSALWMAASMLWIIDSANNIAMEPFRAYVGDQLPKEQVTQGFAFQTFFIGAGAIIASSLPFVLTNWFSVANTAAPGAIPASVTYAFYFGGAMFLLAVLWTVIKSREYSPQAMARYHPESAPHARAGVADFLKSMAQIPPVMRQLISVQFFTWFAWATMWTFATAALTQHVYHSSDTSSVAYNDGASWLGMCYTVYSAAACAFAFLLPVMATRTSRKTTHAICLAIGGLSFVAIYFATTPVMFMLPFIGIGLAWASTLSMPYAILACNLPASKMGLYMGMFNILIVAPQLVSNLVGGMVLTAFFGNNAILMLVLSGVSMLVAAALSLWRVQEAD